MTRQRRARNSTDVGTLKVRLDMALLQRLRQRCLELDRDACHVVGPLLEQWLAEGGAAPDPYVEPKGPSLAKTRPDDVRQLSIPGSGPIGPNGLPSGMVANPWADSLTENEARLRDTEPPPEPSKVDETVLSAEDVEILNQFDGDDAA